MGDFFDRLLRGRQSDARGPIRKQVQPFERKRKMRAALVVGDGVNLVDDHRLDVAENRAAAVGGQKDVERLGRGDQDVRRALQHLAPLFHQRVAGADGGANLRHQQAALGGQCQDFAQRTFEILLNIVAQRFQRRDVENFGRVAQRAGERLSHQAINADQKGCERFAGSCGSRDKSCATGENLRPALLLRLGWRAKAADEPLGNQRMRPGQSNRNFPHSHV